MRQVIAALDLGTSKTIALVVQKNYAGELSVFCTETLPSKATIRRGRVYKLNETLEIISKLIEKLNGSLPSPLEKIYVGIGGQSLHSQLFIVKRVINGEIVSQQLLNSMREEALCSRPEFEDNLGIFSCEYYTDGHLVSNPLGTIATVVEARFQLIVGNPCLKRNLDTIFRKGEIAVADYYISPLATAEAVLTPEEKEKGCALVEWGEGVTYVSVYKKKALKYLATLPLGGLTITKDIRSLNVLENEAEMLKIKYGSALLELAADGDVPVNEEQNSSRRIELSELNSIIEARAEEIIKNVWNQIQASGYSQTLEAGIVITGGGALLRNLPKLIQNQTGKEVRLANAKVWDNQEEIQVSPANSCVVGLAIMGNENCMKEVVEVQSTIPFEIISDPVRNVQSGGNVTGKKNKNFKQPKNPATPSVSQEKRPLGEIIKKRLEKFINTGMDEIFPKTYFESTDNENDNDNE